MAFEGFPKNSITFTCSSNQTYTSVFIPRPKGSSKPAILFLHGFPSSSFDWHNQIKHFSSKGYGVIAPDLLGYGGTSSPPTLEPYAFKNMANDIIELIKHCGVKVNDGEKLHVVGHDFGSIFLGTLLGYYPSIALTASFLAVPYAPPGHRVDMEKMKAITEKHLGFELLGYRRFLWRDDCWRIIGEHKESFFRLAYGPEEYQSTDFLPPGKMEAWLLEDRRVALQSWVMEEYKETRDKIFVKEDAYRGPTDWYRSRFRDSTGIDEEVTDLGKEVRILCPVMYVQSKGATIPDEFTKERAGTYVYKEIEESKGHFLQLEAPKAINEVLEGFFSTYEGAKAEAHI